MNQPQKTVTFLRLHPQTKSPGIWRSGYKLKMLVAIVLGALVLILLLLPNTAPYSPFYPLKRAQENLFLGLKSTPQDKAEYQIELLNSRLAELKQVVENKSYTWLLSASLRYSTTAGRLTELVEEAELISLKTELISLYPRHQKSLQTLLDIYPEGKNDEWKYLQDDINYLTLYLQKLAD